MVAILLIIASQKEDHIFTNNLKWVIGSWARYHCDTIIIIKLMGKPHQFNNFHLNLFQRNLHHLHHRGHNALTTDKFRDEVHQPVAGEELAAAHVLHHPADQVGEGSDQLEDCDHYDKD